MKSKIKTNKIFFIFAVIFMFVLLAFPVKKTALTASAQVRYDDLIHIQAYQVDMTVNEDRTVQVKERITVEFLQHGLTMFYRSLPKESARYYDISAVCNDGKEFYYTVENNPDNSDFIDINCIGGAQKGNIRTYDIAFTMQNGLNAGTKKDGMIIDVIPFGFTVDLHAVSGVVRFPFAVSAENCVLYSGYGSETEDTTLNKRISEDGKTLTFSAEVLPLSYSERFDEYVAKGVTVDFSFTDGEFENYTAVRLFTDELWIIVLLSVIAVALALVVAIFTRVKRELITMVNITAPDSMDPMKMGKLLDGTADSEDVTSMIYYFAHKGYLTIDLTDEDNPVFRKVKPLPSDASAHEKTLFEGLFASGEEVSAEDLQYKFFESVEKAKLQVLAPKMYEKKSVLGYISGGIIATLFALLVPLILGTIRLGKDYACVAGIVFALPVAVILFLGYVRENYRYKWKKKTQVLLALANVGIAIAFSLVFLFFAVNHVLTEYEKAIVCVVAFVCVFCTSRTLSRREDYLQTLGQILGFKEFIVYTEEDKIKFMLEENPELYYKVLPYAQVLGVTDEWTEKFENLLIEPPQWCTCSNISLFDIWLLNRCMRSAFIVATARPQQKGGGFIGGSGGGGSFGGFGGGGFGGGGGGAR
ncbi:MAG: DUF2207 domain-containing protein [Clostridiales bacterium]|nr:DUF2207 domain-containing protein [Clostridiales bacterium]